MEYEVPNCRLCKKASRMHCASFSPYIKCTNDKCGIMTDPYPPASTTPDDVIKIWKGVENDAA